MPNLGENADGQMSLDYGIINMLGGLWAALFCCITAIFVL
jgi:hypothetical protein